MIKAGLVLACAGAVAALLWAERRERARGLKWFAKPAASAAFVALALASGALESFYGQRILAGLVLCFAGDILLIPRAKRAFLAGMGAFAAGHLAYAGAFASIWAGPSPDFLAAALAMTAALAVILRWLWPHLGEFRGPVAGYCLVIGAMAAMSFATTAPGGGAPYWPAVAGAAGFAISDIAVARDQFVKREFFNRAWGLPLYYAAQLLLAASVSQFTPARLS